MIACTFINDDEDVIAEDILEYVISYIQSCLQVMTTQQGILNWYLLQKLCMSLSGVWSAFNTLFKILNDSKKDVVHSAERVAVVMRRNMWRYDLLQLHEQINNAVINI